MSYRFLVFSLFLLFRISGIGCSILYFVDEKTGAIYVANNEDYWFDVKPYIKIVSQEKKELSRLWFGWDGFGQGGINEAGVFIDGAVTPHDSVPEGYGSVKGNFTDEILATCSSVTEVLFFMEEKKLALNNAHVLVGDSTGRAVVIEWVNGEQIVIENEGEPIVVTNFLLSDTTKGNFPCPRFQSIEERIENLKQEKEINLLKVGNLLGAAAQAPFKDYDGREGGTLYSTFIDVTNMKFFLVYQLDNSKVTQLDLEEEFNRKQNKKLKLE